MLAAVLASSRGQHLTSTGQAAAAAEACRDSIHACDTALAAAKEASQGHGRDGQQQQGCASWAVSTRSRTACVLATCALRLDEPGAAQQALQEATSCLEQHAAEAGCTPAESWPVEHGLLMAAGASLAAASDGAGREAGPAGAAAAGPREADVTGLRQPLAASNLQQQFASALALHSEPAPLPDAAPGGGRRKKGAGGGGGGAGAAFSAHALEGCMHACMAPTSPPGLCGVATM